MKNFVFISPNFPSNYWLFCRALKNNGVNVLGIGDAPYDELTQEQKDSMTEYFLVDSLHYDDQVYRAIAFFIFKYGSVDWIESNNEYWIARDAYLRTQYNIKNGFGEDDIRKIKYKSAMKEYYEKAGIPTARYHLVDTLEGCKEFIAKVHYPVIVKPDNGVGANNTFKITNDEELSNFFSFIEKDDDEIPYIMEEFVKAEICSYDAIIDNDGNPIFEAGNISPISIMDIVNNEDSCAFYILNKLPADTKKAGRAAVKSFGVKNRFVHFEFFRLTENMKNLGKKGDLVGLEVNMRPSGGYTPDMINYAYSTDVYQIWADMIAFGESRVEVGKGNFCAFIGRRDGKHYNFSHEELMSKYHDSLRLHCRMPQVLASAMGNYMYIGTFPTQKKLDAFLEDGLKIYVQEEEVVKAVAKNQPKNTSTKKTAAKKTTTNKTTTNKTTTKKTTTKKTTTNISDAKSSKIVVANAIKKVDNTSETPVNATKSIITSIVKTEAPK